MRSNNSTNASAYGTIRASAPPSPAIVDPLPRASPPSYAMPPSYTTYATSGASPAGYIKVPISDPSQPFVIPASSSPPFVAQISSIAAVSPPVPELQPSPATRFSDLFTNLKEQGNALIAARRPWQELLHPPSFSRPANSGDAITRMRRNAAYFRANYILTILSILLVGLLYHPFSFFACMFLFAAWFFLYFSRNGPLVIFGKTFDDGSVLATLCGATIIAIMFTSVGWNVIGSLISGVAIVGLHAAFRSTDDLFLNEQETATGGLINQGLINQVTNAAAPYVRIV